MQAINGYRFIVADDNGHRVFTFEDPCTEATLLGGLAAFLRMGRRIWVYRVAHDPMLWEVTAIHPEADEPVTVGTLTGGAHSFDPRFC